MQIGVSTYLPSNEDLLGEYSPKNCSGSNKKILLKSIVVHHNIFVSSSFAYKMIYISDSQPGTRVPLGVCFKFTGGTQADCRKVTTFKSMGKEPILVFLVPKLSHFFIWGYNLCQFFIQGYTEWVQHDLGVREYQKVENPWSRTNEADFITLKQENGKNSKKINFYCKM